MKFALVEMTGRSAQAGDRYLEREHTYTRFLNRELWDITSRETYERQGDRFFKQLFYNPELFRQVEDERAKDSARIIHVKNGTKTRQFRICRTRKRFLPTTRSIRNSIRAKSFLN